MHRELLVKRFIQLLYECDTWIRYNSSDTLTYSLDISSRVIFATYIDKEERPATSIYPFKTTLYSDTRISLPFVNTVSTRQLLQVLLDSINKLYGSNLTNLLNDLNDKGIYNLNIKPSSKANISIVVNVRFESPIDRLKGLVNFSEYTSKSTRFIDVA